MAPSFPQRRAAKRSVSPGAGREHRREVQDKARASVRRILRVELPTVKLGNLAANVQAQSQSPGMILVVGLVERVEDVRPVLDRHADPAVAYSDRHGLAVRQPYLDVD